MSDSYDLVVLGGGIVGIWTATQAEAAGLRVALVEAGPLERKDQTHPLPPIIFSSRENLGATQARNHVLGGNAAHWGGGLVRNPSDALAKMFVPYPPGATDLLAADYEAVESFLGVERKLIALEAPLVEKLEVDEILVLPGRRRNLGSEFSEALASRKTTITCFAMANIISVERTSSGNLTSVTLEADRKQHVLTASTFVVSMGAIDSNLFVQRFFGATFDPHQRDALGRRLHDHWSIPVASLRWRNGTPASMTFPPKFQAGGISGRRLRFSDGFFHVQANYDALPPYDRVKAFLSARQKREAPWRLMRRALATMGRPWLMAKAGVHYLLERELLVNDGLQVALTLDFESCAHRENRVWQDGDHAVLDWDVREEDSSRFRGLIAEHGPRLQSFFESHGVAVEWQLLFQKRESMDEFFRKHAVDAYHLGGGLQAAPAESIHTTNHEGCLLGCSNVFVNSTATFARPGPANPVLTLLARAHAFVQRLPKTAKP